MTGITGRVHDAAIGCKFAACGGVTAVVCAGVIVVAQDLAANTFSAIAVVRCALVLCVARLPRVDGHQAALACFFYTQIRQAGGIAAFATNHCAGVNHTEIVFTGGATIAEVTVIFALGILLAFAPIGSNTGPRLA